MSDPRDVLPDAAPIAVEKPTTYNKKAQYVAIALIILVVLGLVVQSILNMSHRRAHNAALEAAKQKAPIITAQEGVGTTDDFGKQQAAARAALQSEADLKTQEDRRKQLLESMGNRTTDAAALAVAGGAKDKALSTTSPSSQSAGPPTREQIYAAFEADETKRALEAMRGGFEQGQNSRRSAQISGAPQVIPASNLGPVPGGAPGGNTAEIERVRATVAGLNAKAEQVRAQNAQLTQQLQDIRAGNVASVGSTAPNMNPADNSTVPNSGAGGPLPTNTSSQSVRKIDSAGANAALAVGRFGESAQNRVYRNPQNSGQAPEESLIPTGTVISAILDNTVISDYDGNWKAVIQRPVYDAANEFILLPAGTKFIGKTYRPSAVNEAIQSGLGFTVQWAIRPDGKRIDFRRSAGLDGAGVAAIHDQVDRHLWAQAFGVLAYAVVGIGPSTSSFGTQPQSAPDAFVRDATSQSRTLGRNFAQKYLSIVPTSTIRAGTPMKIFVEDDIYVTPWAPVDARFFASAQ